MSGAVVSGRTNRNYYHHHMPDDNYFMDLALAQARHALAEDELPVGCVVVDAGAVIGSGRRIRGGHTTLDHAEMSALREAVNPPRTNGRGLALFTTLEPCAMCFGAIAHNRISRVVYALEDPYGGATKTELRGIKRHKQEMPEIHGGVRREEARELFKRFFRSTENPYWKRHRDNELLRVAIE